MAPPPIEGQVPLMDIRCPSCKTLYEFNENRIKHGSVKLKCSQCGHVFRVESQAKPESKAKRTGRWMVRRSNQEVLYFQGLTTLQKWIIDRKVGPEDEISRSGKSWKRLGAITELASFFEVAQSIDSLQKDRPAPAVAAVTPIAPPSQEELEPDLFDPMAADSQDEAVPPAGGPRLDMDISSEMAPPRPLEPRSVSMGSFDDDLSDYGIQGGGSKVARVVVALLLVAALIGGGWVYLEHPEWLGLGASPEVVEEEPGQDAAMDAALAQNDAASEGDVPDAAPDAVAEVPGDAGDTGKNAGANKTTKEKEKRAGKDKKRPETGGAEGAIQRGNRALRAGKKQRALEAFSAAVKENPGSAEAHRGLGWAYVSLGLSSGAVRSFKAAIRLSPRYGDAYIGLGKAYRMAGNNAAAAKAYERYLSMYPNGPSAYTARYQLESLRGKGGTAPKGKPAAGQKTGPGGGTKGAPPPGATVGPLPDKVIKKN